VLDKVSTYNIKHAVKTNN